ncbi:uncharacterized protein DS421_15g499030 [Arachis hypogaea]|nr:uncharacterized protein DS421_15g499030 [Arachis hypogaea]
MFNFDISSSENMENMDDIRGTIGIVVSLPNESASIISPTALLSTAPAPHRNIKKPANSNRWAVEEASVDDTTKTENNESKRSLVN